MTQSEPHNHASQGGRATPVFVLARPQMGENIGASARAMWNFGLDRMRIVAPRDGWPNPRAEAMASGAGRVLDLAQIYQTSAEALADCTHVFATTARPRDLNKRALCPKEAIAEAQALIADGEQVGVIFGPERAGLKNSTIVQANAIISIPVNPDFASLNLAQAVGLVAYEWRRALGSVAQLKQNTPRSQRANLSEVEALHAHFEESLEAVNFFWPEAKAGSMKSNFRNMFSRFEMTSAEVKTLHGILRALKSNDISK